MPHRALQRPHAHACWEAVPVRPQEPSGPLDSLLPGQTLEAVSAQDPTAGLLQMQVCPRLPNNAVLVMALLLTRGCLDCIVQQLACKVSFRVPC